MAARQVVLLPPSKSSNPAQLPFYKYIAPVNPLDATLAKLSTSVANKKLTGALTLLDATLTQKVGAGGYG